MANDSIDINRTKESTPPVSASPDPSKTFSVKDLKKQQESWHESPEKNESIHANNGYGEIVINNKGEILTALGLNT